MLKKRIIPIQLLINNRLVKTIEFGKYRDVGNPVSSSKIYNDSDADELIFLNINREERSIEPLLTLGLGSGSLPSNLSLLLASITVNSFL